MKRSLAITIIVLASLTLTVGVVKAASAVYDTLTIGRQGVGGVTYFNGTMKNNTTGTGGADNPVTIGDNLRIDGRVYRGATAGTGDSSPFIINDNLEVAGTIVFNGSRTAVAGKVYTGSVDITQNGDEIVTSTDVACSVPSGLKNYSFHYKKVAVAEVTVAALPDIRVYTKAPAYAPMNIIPNGGNAWGAASYVFFSDGYVYFAYKYVTNFCDGTSITTNYMSGDGYQIVVQS